MGSRFMPHPLQAEDLSSIVAMHRDYVTTLHDRCLLDKKVGWVGGWVSEWVG